MIPNTVLKIIGSGQHPCLFLTLRGMFPIYLTLLTLPQSFGIATYIIISTQIIFFPSSIFLDFHLCLKDCAEPQVTKIYMSYSLSPGIGFEGVNALKYCGCFAYACTEAIPSLSFTL